MHTLSAMGARRITLPVWFIGAILIAAAYILARTYGTPAHYLAWDIELLLTLQMFAALRRLCCKRCAVLKFADQKRPFGR